MRAREGDYFASRECFCCGQCTPAGPYEQQKKFGQLTLTRETVATDPCTLEGPSPGGDGGDTVGTKALLVTQKLKNWLYTPASRTAVTPLSS